MSHVINRARTALVVLTFVVAACLAALSGATSASAAGTAGTAAVSACSHCGQRSFPLRDRCGGANGKVAWNQKGASAWGEVWTLHNATCGAGTHWVELFVNGYFMGSGAAAPAGTTVGFNIGPADNPGGQLVGVITVALCSSEIGGRCNDQKTFFV